MLNVFYDTFSLREGERFDKTFMLGMARSHVVTPFVTAHALKRMCEPDSWLKVDNVLLEWWLALTLHTARIGAVSKIIPVFVGEV